MSEFQLRKKPENKISRESAVEQVVTILEYYDYDVAAIEDADEREKAEKTLNKITRSIMRGSVEVVDSGDGPFFRQHTKNGETLEYSGSITQAKAATDGHASTQRYAMIYSFMGSLSGDGAAAMKKLSGRDATIMEDLANFLTTVSS